MRTQDEGARRVNHESGGRQAHVTEILIVLKSSNNRTTQYKITNNINLFSSAYTVAGPYNSRKTRNSTHNHAYRR